MNQPISEHAATAGRELGLRVASAVAMAAVTLSATWLGAWVFAGLAGVVAVLVAWEWGRLVRGAAIDLVLVSTSVAIVVAVALTQMGWPRPALLVLAAGAIVAALLAWGDRPFWAAMGAVYAGAPAVALVWLRSGEPHGLAVILMVLVVVWTTDTGAFIAGRSIGGPKLWVAVSPNKTWSGLAGGVLAAGVVAWTFAHVVGSAEPLRVGLVGMILAVISQAGDLFESAMKRNHGVKDTSGLIPGHGGVMDRVDGLVVAAVAAALMAALSGSAAPSHALLGIVAP